MQRDGQLDGPLTGDDAKLAELDANPYAVLGPEQVHLMMRNAPPPSAEWEQEHYAKLRAQGIDFEAIHAAINRGDNETAEHLLEALATPSRDEVAILERRINDAFWHTARRRPARVPLRRNRVPDRGRSGRRVRRTVRLAAHGPPGRPRPASGDDDPPSPTPLASSHGFGRAFPRVRWAA
jgi:hypothetical protein